MVSSIRRGKEIRRIDPRGEKRRRVDVRIGKILGSLSPFSSEMVLLGFPSAWFGERRAVNTSLLPDWPACLTKKRRRLRILFAPRKNCLDFLFSLPRKLTLEIYFKIPLPSCATSIGRGGEEEKEKTIGPSFPPFLLLSWPCQRASRQRREEIEGGNIECCCTLSPLLLPKNPPPLRCFERKTTKMGKVNWSLR